MSAVPVVASAPAPAAPKKHLAVLTNSEKRCFRSCRRKHYITYRLLKRARFVAEPLRFGSLVHRGLEAWWIARMDGEDALAVALEVVESCDFATPLDIVKASELLVAYHARWSDEAIEVLAVEAEFTAPIVNPTTGAASRTYQAGGKIDAIARMADGNVYIVEHKTTAEDVTAGSDYWKRLRLDSQISDYYVGARALGYEVAGCLYDVIAKPKLQPLEATPAESRKYKQDGTLYKAQRDRDETLDEFRLRLRAHVAENIERYFARGTIVRLVDDERDAAFDSWQTAREIREADLATRFPRNPDACVKWGQTCEFFAVCSREADIDDPTRFRTAKRAHEELAQPAPSAAATVNETRTEEIAQ